MFGKNEIVGKKFFKTQSDRTLMVTSRFYTIQGEGPFRGEPAVFVRLAKCNLACSFCDTYFDSGDVMTFDDIFKQCDDEIASFYSSRGMEVPDWAKGNNRRIVMILTGGEPTIQPNLVEFLEEANKIYARTQIESNGIVPVDLPPQTTYVVSPKCNEKDGVATKYFRPNQHTLDSASCLKFVVGVPESDRYSPYSEVPDWAHEWAKETGKPVFVSPMNIYKKEPAKAKTMRSEKEDISIGERSVVDEVISFWEDGLLDMQANQRNHEYAAEYAMKYGFILNLQIHLYASLA